MSLIGALLAGLVGMSGWWWAPALCRAVGRFLDADLQTKDSTSSVIAMAVGACSLLLALLQFRREQRQQTNLAPPSTGREPQTVEELRARLCRQGRFMRIGRPLAAASTLRVHPAPGVPTAPEPATSGWGRLFGRSTLPGPVTPLPDLPLFVDRDKGNQIKEWMRKARTHGGFMILVGDSCVGKTRLLYEATREVLPDFAVFAPDLGDGEIVNTLAGATSDMPRLVVWLDELQRFLTGPYLTNGSSPITAAAVRKLLDSPTPVVILGTLWPAHAAALRVHDPIPSPDTAPEQPRYPETIDILTDRRVNEIRLDTFSRSERTTAARLASLDPRLATAVADRDYNVTEALAGARELINRYDRATTTQRAVLHAAVDARRVGIQSPLETTLLQAAARGYLCGLHIDDAWFPHDLKELTSTERPQDKATAPLIPIFSADHRHVMGYTIADYLLQRLTSRRRTEPLPAFTWHALAAHVHTRDDLVRLSDSAANRLLYEHALPAYRRLAAAGDEYATSRLADILDGQGRTGELVEALRPRAAAGDADAAKRLADVLVGIDCVDEAIQVLEGVAANDWGAAETLAVLLVEYGRVEELRIRADAGDGEAAWQLAGLLVDQERFDELRSRADSGDGDAAWRLVDALTDRDQVEEAIAVLRTRADAGDLDATGRLIGLLSERGRAAEAMALLRRQADHGSGDAAWLLSGMLAHHNGLDELRARADAGDSQAARRLTNILLERNETDEATTVLRRMVEAGDVDAARRLTDVLVEHGRLDEATELLHSRPDDAASTRWLTMLLVDRGQVDKAIHLLTTHAAKGDGHAATRLNDLLAEQGRIDELRNRADAGHGHAATRLADLLAERGRVDEAIGILAVRATGGDGHAAIRLDDLLAEQGRIDELRSRTETGDWYAAEWLTDLLADQGRTADVEQILRVRAEAGDAYAAIRLADLLTTQDHVSEAIEILRARADTGDRTAAQRLTDLLFRHDRMEDLHAEVLAGTAGAAEQWLLGLARQGRTELAEKLKKLGMTTDDLSADEQPSRERPPGAGPG